ncbi:hypothetical protein GURASL_34850 [Geotalea uraniireducens]|uniref:Uncharacterized protein n=1 Tax=Geotalea uraniireducens TaxID=351604 RepID=A0ABM8EQ36_9BACT|nr:hypothetical protein [Geotalea uraniireducens]BDV44562.1 hypothetical protein GURASL_34850 [Geotalea uraniireducens]
MTDEQLMVLKDSLDMLTAATIVNATYTARLIELQGGFDQEKISPLLSETNQLINGLKNIRRVEDLCKAQTNPE